MQRRSRLLSWVRLLRKRSAAHFLIGWWIPVCLQGANSHGQLANGAADDAHSPVEALPLPDSRTVDAVAGGGTHTITVDGACIIGCVAQCRAVLTLRADHGDVWGVGLSDVGQLGRPVGGARHAWTVRRR
jgi:hypothetical protein